MRTPILNINARMKLLIAVGHDSYASVLEQIQNTVLRDDQHKLIIPIMPKTLEATQRTVEDETPSYLLIDGLELWENWDWTALNV